jgi:hypothetical protein
MVVTACEGCERGWEAQGGCSRRRWREAADVRGEVTDIKHCSGSCGASCGDSAHLKAKSVSKEAKASDANEYAEFHV